MNEQDKAAMDRLVEDRTADFPDTPIGIAMANIIIGEWEQCFTSAIEYRDSLTCEMKTVDTDGEQYHEFSCGYHTQNAVSQWRLCPVCGGRKVVTK